MKTPLRYQLSEYDCGPTSLLNAVSYLFERQDIPPEIIRKIISVCISGHGDHVGKMGTSTASLIDLTNWLNSFGKRGELAISALYVSGGDAGIGEDSYAIQAVRRGAAVVLHVFLDGIGHYVLLTGEDEEHLYLFDPYFSADPVCPRDEADIVQDLQPFHHNRVVTKARMRIDCMDSNYALGPLQRREAVLVYNTETFPFDFYI